MAGCRVVSVSKEPERPSPARPVWREALIEEHLRFFNGAEAEGRQTGTPGMARVAAYVASRMSEFSLQPVLVDDYLVAYPVPLNVLHSASMSVEGPDSLRFSPAIDFLPDGRSDSGAVVLHDLHVALGIPDTTAAAGTSFLRGRGVLIPDSAATTPFMQWLRRQGVTTVLVAGPLALKSASSPLPGMIVVRILPHVARRLIPDLKADHTPGWRTTLLEAPLSVRVAATYYPSASAVNVMGYVAGKNPELSDELILVCADIDAIGPAAGSHTLDLQHFGIGAAAMLELARNYSFFARRSFLPERTILFAVFSGSRMERTGMEQYLQTPFWPLQKTHSVLYVGLPEERRMEVKQTLDAYHIPLRWVAPPADTLFGSGRLFVPAQVQHPAPPGSPSKNALTLSGIFQRARVEAIQMAEEGHRMLLQEVVTPAPVQPMVDSLWTPAGTLR